MICKFIAYIYLDGVWIVFLYLFLVLCVVSNPDAPV